MISGSLKFEKIDLPFMYHLPSAFIQIISKTTGPIIVQFYSQTFLSRTWISPIFLFLEPVNIYPIFCSISRNFLYIEEFFVTDNKFSLYDSELFSISSHSVNWSWEKCEEEKIHSLRIQHTSEYSIDNFET